MPSTHRLATHRLATYRLARFVLGAQAEDRLPDRVRASVDAQQRQSELLVGWVQLSVVVLFGTLYLVAPKTSGGTDFMPVPYALGGYLAFTLLRLWLAHRGRLGPVLLFVSVIVDMGLLMGLIWSFHVQYEQSAPFYLKAPTLLYVFIFIALRALRFQALYVVAAGLAAAAGWAALLAYAVVTELNMGMPMITRDYVAYMTSNTILVGAEVDKIVSILTVTAILAIALVRGRRLLERAVSDSLTATEMSRFVAPEVARRISQSGEVLRAGDGEVHEGTVLFTDIEGFTTLSEQVDPRTLMTILSDYFGAVNAVAEANGGVIVQFNGDALLIHFGGGDGSDHARRAVATARAIVDDLSDRPFGPLGHRLRTRCGLNTGPVILGAVGAANRLIFTAHGDAVNLAARLEQLNKEYGTAILMSEATAMAAGVCREVAPAGDIVVRGRQTPTRVFALPAQEG
ncbi:adenylate/guanylate cyclase domain-containing protein [Roseospira marina]|uniref:adenylate/guanylate cyclase domain-containing protein n=1 Tax=Roseospira marina TaxID=140057 RepID=UPI00181A88B2|nr:adenylate/guanylate cyclase domain-containing protein [Roseospira marina]MBB4313349.1 adenylate cyclase [Roseospira marina]MBB5085910.1 adenylate cyclase [Roseospira marina]